MSLIMMIICAVDGIVIGMALSGVVKQVLAEKPLGRLLNVLAWIAGIVYFLLALATLESDMNFTLAMIIVFAPTAIGLLLGLITYVFFGNSNKENK